jgi:hypothetical protein
MPSEEEGEDESDDFVDEDFRQALVQSMLDFELRKKAR